jgi:hypothetical protein
VLTPCEQAPSHSDFAFIQDNVFTPSCAVAGCHTGAFPRATLDLTAGRAHASLVGVASTEYTGWTRVVPGNAPASLLLVQVGGETGPDQGSMPWNQPKLCTPLVDAMRRWVVAGAPP